MNTSLRSLLMACLALLAIGTYPAASLAAKPDPQNAIIGNPPPDSPFAKIELGMPEKEVTDLIGQPSDRKVYSTGKAAIPFVGIFSHDLARIELHYKGQGIITLTGGVAVAGGGVWKVYRVIYDPNENGYAK
jgi:hypothetical protein